MGLITPDLSGLVDGQTADASDVKNPLNTIINEFNGNISSNNFSYYQVMGTIYPIGTVYTNATVSTNPAALLGFGTWVSIGDGLVMVNYKSGDSDFGTLGATGGEKTHTLSTTEIPAHNHSASSSATSTGSISSAGVHTHGTDPTYWGGHLTNTGGVTLRVEYDWGEYPAVTSSAGDHSHAVSISTSVTTTTSNTGSDGAHNNLSPYVVVYAWKRTA